MGTNPKFDDAIDKEVDRALADLATDTPAEFKARVNSLSGIAKIGLQAMVREQIAVERDNDRLNRLLDLKTRLR